MHWNVNNTIVSFNFRWKCYQSLTADSKIQKADTEISMSIIKYNYIIYSNGFQMIVYLMNDLRILINHDSVRDFGF